MLTLFPNLVQSLVEVAPKFPDEVELVVSDWGSTDWPLAEWLPEKVGNHFDHNIINIKDEKFSRGKGRNIALSFAKGDKILFLDTDMLLENAAVLTAGNSIVNKDTAYFPACFSYYDHQHIDGWWRTTGFGNMMATREQLRKVGPWKEKYSWGGEDDDMFLKMARSSSIIREKVVGFSHQWHPEEKPIVKPKRSVWNKIFGGRR